MSAIDISVKIDRALHRSLPYLFQKLDDWIMLFSTQVLMNRVAKRQTFSSNVQFLKKHLVKLQRLEQVLILYLYSSSIHLITNQKIGLPVGSSHKLFYDFFMSELAFSQLPFLSG